MLGATGHRSVSTSLAPCSSEPCLCSASLTPPPPHCARAWRPLPPSQVLCFIPCFPPPCGQLGHTEKQKHRTGRAPYSSAHPQRRSPSAALTLSGPLGGTDSKHTRGSPRSCPGTLSGHLPVTIRNSLLVFFVCLFVLQ